MYSPFVACGLWLVWKKYHRW